jgi:hypothetical protein
VLHALKHTLHDGIKCKFRLQRLKRLAILVHKGFLEVHLRNQLTDCCALLRTSVKCENVSQVMNEVIEPARLLVHSCLRKNGMITVKRLTASPKYIPSVGRGGNAYERTSSLKGS